MAGAAVGARRRAELAAQFDAALASREPAPPWERWADQPAAWVAEAVAWRPGEGLAGYQAETLTELARHRRVALRGPHGLGKTTDAALAVLWFALTRDALERDWKVATTAGAWRQLEHYLWPEIHKWARRLRWPLLGRGPFDDRRELMSLNLRLRHGAAFAVASDLPALIEGVHADAVLYVFDEAKSISGDTFDAAEGAFAGQGEALALALSTPGEPAGRFYDLHRRAPGFEDRHARHITLAEAVAAGRISPGWAAQRARQWGPGSAIYANRVLGEFASSETDGVVPLAWVEQAQERWRAWQEQGAPGQGGPERVGVDVARGGEDATVLAVRDGWAVGELRRPPAGEDTMQTAGRVAGLLRARPKMRAVVDVIGLGAGVLDRLREQRLDAVGFTASEATRRRDRSGELFFTNVRSAAWWNLRELLQPELGELVVLPPDDLLVGDLCAPRYRLMSGGKLQVEAKDDIRKRLGRSPDAGDAVVQAFWETAGPASFGGSVMAGRPIA